MNKITLKLMARIETRLNNYVHLEMVHCGHDEEVIKAEKSRKRLMLFLANEIDRLVVLAEIRDDLKEVDGEYRAATMKP